MSKHINVSDGNFNVTVQNGNAVIDVGAGGQLRLTGSLVVEGDTQNITSINTTITDNIILLNASETGAGVTLNSGKSGIEVERGTDPNVSWVFSELPSFGWEDPQNSDIVTYGLWAPQFLGDESYSAILTPAIKNVPGANLNIVITPGDKIVIQGETASDYATDLTDNNLANKFYVDSSTITAIDNRVTKTFVDALNVDADTLDGINSLGFVQTGAIGVTVQGYTTVLNNTTASYTTTEETKLSNIETAATADQTNLEIKTAYELNSDTNAFTDALDTKLTNIETAATADQTNLEIKTAYELNSDTNAFTDALDTKLSNLEAGLIPHTVVSADKTFGLTDANDEQQVDAVAILTIPTNAIEAFLRGDKLLVLSITASTVTVTASVGVTLNGIDGGSTDLTSQYSDAVITKIGTDAWAITGSIGTVT
jgi:hypothetical protein